MRLLILALALTLGGCGIAATTRTQANYDLALTNYRTCINANGPAGCAREKAILDADAAAYRSARTGSTIVVQEN